MSLFTYLNKNAVPKQFGMPDNLPAQAAANVPPSDPKRINASPTKDFFIHMLVRDIPLNRAVIDLVDNSVDGARRLRRDQSFEGLWITGADLRGAGYASVCLRVVQNEIQTILSNRSGPLPEQRKLLYRQLINLTYADDAQMMTVGGLIFENQDTHLVDKCAFGEVPFVNSDLTTTLLRAPKFTLKELRELNSKLPETETEKARLPGVPETDLTEYAKIYRYYPSFGEVLLG